MQNAALMRASTDLAVGGANAVSNLAAATMAAAGQVGANAVRTVGDVTSAREAINDAYEGRKADLVARMVGFGALTGLGVAEMRRPQAPFPTYTPPAQSAA